MDNCGELHPNVDEGASCHQSDIFSFDQLKNLFNTVEDFMKISTKLDDENRATIARLMNEKAQLKLQRDKLKLESYIMKKQIEELRAEQPKKKSCRTK